MNPARFARSSVTSFAASFVAACLASGPLAGAAAAQKTFLTWDGNSAGDSLGYSVAGAGDVNGDGYPDVIVGARDDSPSGIAGAGSAYVYSGKDGTLIWAEHGTQVGEVFGYSVAGVGDLNHDGFADFAVGATQWDNAVGTMNVGAVHVFNGKTGAKFFTFGGTQVNDLYGASITGCGDWNADGTPDIAVGAPDFDETIFGVVHPDTGRVMIISGTVPSSILHTFNGVDDGENFGWSVRDVGDWDADGFHDIVVGSPSSPTSVALGGKARVYSGKLMSLLFTAQGTVALGSLGYSVGAAGDVNNDGKDDIVVGAYGENSNSGAVRVFLGSTGTASWVKFGEASNDRLGGAVCGVGDVNHDGFDDFAGGAYGGSTPGWAKVWSGKDASLLYSKLAAPAGGEQFGAALAGPGDLDQDGWVDLLVGDYAFDGPAGTDAGRAFAYDIVIHQINLGFGGPGTATLDMYGTPLVTGGTADIHLKGAKPGANCWLVASAAQANAPFKGGILVPNVGAAVITPFTTTAQGTVVLPGVAGGGGPFSVFLQFVVKDNTQPQGYALSNAVVGAWGP